jgi:hypothetical protein
MERICVLLFEIQYDLETIVEIEGDEELKKKKKEFSIKFVYK